ncbi:MAG: hypothetical protein GY863_21700 [bacterium]|nr:hypothetical protein [bacterium]
MRTISCTIMICITACFLLFSCSGAPNDSSDNVSNTNYEATESFSYKLAVSSQADLTVSTGNGSIWIVGVANSDSIIITGEKSVRSESEEDAEAHLEQVIISVASDATEVIATTQIPANSNGRIYGAEYTIYVPDYFGISASNINGEITIGSIHNNVYVSNVNAPVYLNDIYGSAYGSLLNGSISSKIYLPADGEVDMIVTNGSLVLRIPDTASAEFDAIVSNGTINVDQIDFEEILYESPGSFSGILGNGHGTITLEVENGSITVVGF